MKRVPFFSTPKDIVPVLRRFESAEPLKFVVLGNLETPNRDIFLRANDIPAPGISTHETGNASTAYMVSLQDTKNHMTKFVGERGEYRWTLDNGDNDETVVITMAGLWRGDVLLPGMMDTLHSTPVAQRLMKRFLSSLKEEKFVKIESWWVGREAYEMLLSGKRLTTTAVQSPPEFDL